MLLVAIDEAGYGPTLGPLVVAATAWQLPDEAMNTLNCLRCFDPLHKPTQCGNSTIVVDDSKKLFRPGGPKGLARLAIPVTVCQHWCDQTNLSMSEWLADIACDDYESIRLTPWLDDLCQCDPNGEVVAEPHNLVLKADADRVIEQWGSAGAKLTKVAVRVITAAEFNRRIDSGQNKSDLLSEVSLQLAAKLVAELSGEPLVAIYFDRQGGRRFYGAVLQHAWPEMIMQVLAESAPQSEYDLCSQTRTIKVFFSVKGDSFAPVALSSMHAKFLREKSMDSLNDYFSRHAPLGQRPRPTAGYPADAARYLRQIHPIMRRLKIQPDRLVRSR